MMRMTGSNALTSRSEYLRLVFTILCLLCAVGFGSPLAGQTLSEDDVIDALKATGSESRARVKTRSLIPAEEPKSAEQEQLIERMQNKNSRAITVEERKEIAAFATERPSIDLEIYFDYDSAEVSSKALPTLITLGRALTSEELKGARFLIAGHTDATGSAEYNQELSDRRAEAVKRLLVQHFDLPENRLLAIGNGFEQLKNPADPFAAENRRVQIVNFAD